MALDVVIDISHHNTITSWSDIKEAGFVGIIHKASQGTTFVDPAYHERRQQALDSGLLWGAYHFAESGPVLPQVTHFLDTVRPTAADLLVLDWEPCSTGTMTLEGAELFVDEVYLATGRWCGLYSGMSFCTDTLGACTDTPLARCWLWLARYAMEPPDVPPAWDVFTLWQWTDQGSVAGVAGPVDIDRFNGTMEELLRLWGVSPDSLRA